MDASGLRISCAIDAERVPSSPGVLCALGILHLLLGGNVIQGQHSPALGIVRIGQ